MNVCILLNALCSIVTLCKKKHIWSIPLCAILGGILSPAAYSEFRNIPNKNTLWIEDGKKIKTGDKPSNLHWWAANSVRPADPGFAWAGSTGRYLPVDPEFPYLVWEITDVKRIWTNANGGSGFTIYPSITGNHVEFAITSFIQKGIYVYKPFFTTPKSPGVFFRFDLWGAELHMKYIAMGKSPKYNIEVTSPVLTSKKTLNLGDDVTFKVTMPEPTEDVTLTFFDSYTMPQLKINGNQRLQLKPDKKDFRIWQATIKLESCEGAARSVRFAPGLFIIKATVLGGGIHVPIWTCNHNELQFDK